MKLSKIIQHVNTINALSTSDASTQLDDMLRDILMTLNHSSDALNLDSKTVNDSIKKVESSLEELNKSLVQFKDKANTIRTEAEVPVLLESNVTRVLEQKQSISDHVITSFWNHIKIYSHWEHAGAVIHPGDGEHVETMLSFDPLYIIDETVELLEPMKTKFNPLFQKRIRYKVLSLDKQLSKILPVEQFGFVLILDFFDFKSIKEIEKYLTEVFTVLKPGGVAMFTYNNCDNPASARNFEDGTYSYTPASLLIPKLKTIGFDIIRQKDYPSNNFNWMEIKKPGELTSIKGGQTLAQIVQ